MKKRSLKKIIKNTLIIGFIFFLVSYTIKNTRLISGGIDLQIEGIENGKIYNDGTLQITGNAKRAKHLLVNGREVSLNQDGDFVDYLVLLPGYNIVTVSAEDKFGKITKQIFDIIREEEVISLESSQGSL